MLTHRVCKGKEYLKVHRVVLFLSVFLCLTIPLISCGEGRKTVPHQIKGGDVISADIFNEIFDSVHNITDGFESPVELVGTWKYTVIESTPNPQFLSCYIAHSSGLFSILEDTIIFTDDGDGTYSFATTKYNILGDYLDNLTTPEVGEYYIVQNKMFTRENRFPPSQGYERMSSLEKISPDKFFWYEHGTNHVMVFERLYTPPAIPTDLTATDTGLDVTLTWTDNSTDETGFKVTRKDTLEGEFAEIGTTTAADTTTYADILTQSGTYWYRVMATNQYGDSLGSNEAMVTVSE